jgi:hypothetical protein
MSGKKQTRDELVSRHGASKQAAERLTDVADQLGSAWGHVQAPGVKVTSDRDGDYEIAGKGKR